MKPFRWNKAKNEELKSKRSISFEEIVRHIQAGHVVGETDHPNQARYKHQRVFFVRIEDYVWLVPFVESEEEFLKTIIPSRKATRHYLGGKSRGQKSR